VCEELREIGVLVRELMNHHEMFFFGQLCLTDTKRKQGASIMSHDAK
jgi:predicted restriction endonuclease